MKLYGRTAMGLASGYMQRTGEDEEEVHGRGLVSASVRLVQYFQSGGSRRQCFLRFQFQRSYLQLAFSFLFSAFFTGR